MFSINGVGVAVGESVGTIVGEGVPAATPSVVVVVGVADGTTVEGGVTTTVVGVVKPWPTVGVGGGVVGMAVGVVSCPHPRRKRTRAAGTRKVDNLRAQYLAGVALAEKRFAAMDDYVLLTIRSGLLTMCAMSHSRVARPL